MKNVLINLMCLKIEIITNNKSYAFKSVFFITFLIVIISCTNNTNIDFGKEKSINDSFRYEVPKNSENTYYINNFYNLVPKLGLEEIKNGYDGSILRIWYKEGSYKDTIKLITIIKSKEGKWNASLGLIKMIYDDKNNLVDLKHESSEKSPSKGWNYFITELNNYNLWNLPDFYSIPNYILNTGGPVITIEVADKGMYRLYAYPHFFTNRKFNEVKNLLHALEAIQSQLSIQLND